MNRILLLLLFIICSCAPYSKGPVLSLEDAERSFKPLVELMDVEPGMKIADVGAGAGVLSVIMATQIEGCTIYIQDIDRSVLSRKNVDKVIDHYSKESGYDMSAKNQFRLVYGDATHSNLPNGEIDLIYSNATIHAFDDAEKMIQDLRTKLAPEGRIFIRDSFKEEGAGTVYCESKKCAKPLFSISELLTLMDRNGFQLVAEEPNLSGYPVFGFAKTD